MKASLKKARRESGIATFERSCRTVLFGSRECLAYKVPGTQEVGRWVMLDRYTQQLANRYQAKQPTAFVEIRSQHSRGSSARSFGGPDTYVAVQVVPAGVRMLTILNRRAAEKRGIKILRIGEGYDEHRGPRSLLGQAIEEAHYIANEINNR